MRRAAVGLACAVMLLTGCGVSTMDRTYDDALIHEVGGGSTAISSIVATLKTQSSLPGSFNDPRDDRAMTLLIQGQLNKLTEDDLVRLAATNRRSAKRFEAVLGKLDDVASNIRRANVDAGSHADVSPGAKRFLTAWDAYLNTNADRVRSMRTAFATMRPVFNEFTALLRASADTARLRSTVRFDKVKERFLADVTRRSARFRNAATALTADGPADRAFTDLVNHNQEAQAIVTKVNERYPHGWLADMFKAN